MMMNTKDKRHFTRCKVLSNRARLAMRNLQFHLAVQLYQAALCEAQVMDKNNIIFARLYWKLGRLAAYHKDFKTAESYWLKSMNIAHSINKDDSFFTLRLYAHLGWNGYQQQQYGTAQIWSDRALNIYPKIKHSKKMTRLVSPLRMLLRLCWMQNQTLDAEKAHTYIGRISTQDSVINQLQAV